MLEYDGDIEVVLNDDIAHFNAQGLQLSLTVSSPEMLFALIGVYRRLPEPDIAMKMPLVFDRHRLVVKISNGGGGRYYPPAELDAYLAAVPIIFLWFSLVAP
ncbi:hypothetical protein [Photobacterium lutimaris]|uniref:Uncharacterized protein n=1 Tax=Photobacterium lutimaris TaxID=388278 RepID=A0A2T3IRG4_9GAMM|nr:hypothetical protein [Photobacterium lutimaris]PSU30946.1 hypothetical protein C9I99_23060 [Photobacterium lutimaris]TDR72181.1 hypothetical protein DFP78_114116 [Photobacterium lutimaris]